MEIRPGDVYWVALEEPDEVGSRIIHPHVVLQNNGRDGTALVCALTSNLKRAKELGNVLLEDGEAQLPKQSVVVVSQASVVRISQLGEYIGSLTEPRVEQILAGIRFQQSLIGSRPVNEATEPSVGLLSPDDS